VLLIERSTIEEADSLQNQGCHCGRLLIERTQPRGTSLPATNDEGRPVQG
jgi:hypothetical protein